MATPTYDPIASTTLASSASSVTFSSLDTIAAGYRDLVLVAEFSADANGYFRLRFNGDSTDSNYAYVYMAGTGSTTGSGSGSQAYVNIGALVRTEAKSLFISQTMDFAETNKHKTTISRFNNTASGTQANAHRWANTSAITSMTLAAAWGNFTAGSTFSLYGIVA